MGRIFLRGKFLQAKNFWARFFFSGMGFFLGQKFLGWIFSGAKNFGGQIFSKQKIVFILRVKGSRYVILISEFVIQSPPIIIQITIDQQIIHHTNAPRPLILFIIQITIDAHNVNKTFTQSFEQTACAQHRFLVLLSTSKGARGYRGFLSDQSNKGFIMFLTINDITKRSFENMQPQPTRKDAMAMAHSVAKVLAALGRTYSERLRLALKAFYALVKRAERVAFAKECAAVTDMMEKAYIAHNVNKDIKGARNIYRSVLNLMNSLFATYRTKERQDTLQTMWQMVVGGGLNHSTRLHVSPLTDITNYSY